MSLGEMRFEALANDLAHPIFKEFKRLEAEYAAETQRLASQIASLESRINTDWPIVGKPPVRHLREVVANRVALWLPELPDLVSPRDVDMARVVTSTCFSAIYRSVEAQFTIPEIKALPVGQVVSCETYIDGIDMPFERIWKAARRLTIKRRMAYWIRRGFITNTPKAIQGTRQALWAITYKHPVTQSDGPVMRKRVLRMIQRATIPARYRA